MPSVEPLIFSPDEAMMPQPFPPEPGPVELGAGSAGGQLQPGHLGRLAASLCLSDVTVGPTDGAVIPHGGNAQGPSPVSSRARGTVWVGRLDSVTGL